MPEAQTKIFLNDINNLKRKNYESKHKSLILHDWNFLDFTHGTLFHQIVKCNKRSQKKHRFVKAWNIPYYIDKCIDDADELSDIAYLIRLHLVSIHKLIYDNRKHCYNACELQLSSFGKKFCHDICNRVTFFSINTHDITELYLKLCHKKLSSDAINDIREALCKEYIDTTCPCRDYKPFIRHVFSQL